MSVIALELHGISEETLRGYLLGLGGELRSPGQIAGPGWTARITHLPDYHLGRAAFCCFQVEMEGEGEALRTAWRRFELRIMRPGG
jgi:hypothetical protein